MSPRATSRTDEWQPVCQLADLEPERGVTALVHGQAVAIFRVLGGPGGEQVFALGNHDPFAKAGAMAKGIVGWRDEVPFVASPLHRHAFDLRSGRCLEERHVAVPAYCVKVEEGVVLVGGRKG